MTTHIKPGHHFLIDFWQCQNLQNLTGIRMTLLEAAHACGATVLDINLHSFGQNAGITGVAILAESHISIHTWPELDYAALDVFMCGHCDPSDSLSVLRKFFQPDREKITKFQRGN